MLLRSTALHPIDEPAGVEDVEVHALNILTSLITDSTHQKPQQESAKDMEILSAVSNIQARLHVTGQFKGLQQELSVVDDILFKQTRVVVPKSVRADMLISILECHLGLNKCKEQERCLVFWLGLDCNIENLIQRHGVCK